MPTYWHKRDWWPSDLDRSNPYKPEFIPGAIPPGIYCEDHEGFGALRRKAWETEPSMTYRPDGQASIGGINVYVATPAQADILRAASTDEPAPEADRHGETLALINSMLDRLKRLTENGTVPRPGASNRPFIERRPSTVTNAIASGVEFLMGRDPAPPPEVRHPFSGANRKAKRAADARARRRA